MEGLMRTQWTSESHIKALLQAAGWPSALLWHKQRGHVPLLSAEGTPPHIFTKQSLLPPTDDLWSCFLAFAFSGTTPYSQPPVTARMWNNLDNLLDTTGKWWYFNERKYAMDYQHDYVYMHARNQITVRNQENWKLDIYRQCNSQCIR